MGTIPRSGLADSLLDCLGSLGLEGAGDSDCLLNLPGEADLARDLKKEVKQLFSTKIFLLVSLCWS